MDRQDIQDLCDSFLVPTHLYSRDEVLTRPSPVPSTAGVYGWWFKALPTTMTTTSCATFGEAILLYTGISPKKPPMNGTAPSRQTLRSRIRTHYAGNAAGSTLRRTLGVLLADNIGVELRRVGGGDRMTFVDGERKLSEWMAENAFVAWIEVPEPWVLEAHLIASVDVPLNLDSNAHNAFHTELSRARAVALRRARDLPVQPNPGTGGR